jgi:hypothetical protein
MSLGFLKNKKESRLKVAELLELVIRRIAKSLFSLSKK